MAATAKPRRRRTSVDASAPELRIDLLDVGDRKYADAILVRRAGATALIDGGHRGDERPDAANLVGQLRALLGDPPFAIDLLVVSHAHDDHIGCLPELVSGDVIKVRDALLADPGLGWGRSPQDFVRPALDLETAALIAALREGPLSPSASDEAIDRLLDDASDVEGRYGEMIGNLRARGTDIVRYGRDPHDALVARQSALRLRILGPSTAQLLLTADAIRGATDQLAEVLSQSDARRDVISAYRSIISGGSDPLADGVSRLGAAVNLQSIVLVVGSPSQRALFAGDMQFAVPGAGGAAVQAEVDALRAVVSEAGPYRFAKLSHHGSANSVDEAWLDSLGPRPVVGISTGHLSRDHPDPDVLAMLVDRLPDMRWVRTDRNRGSSVRIKAGTGAPIVEVRAGAPNDASLPVDTETATILPPSPKEERPVLPTPPVQVVSAASGTAGPIDVRIRVPPGTPTVRVTIESMPSMSNQPVSVATIAAPVAPTPDSRAYPPLLYVTAPNRLRANVGQAEADAILATLRARPGEVIELPDNADVKAAQATVRARIKRAKPAGVVLIGGYDVVASERVDALPPSIRADLRINDDADDFIVWSDDGFGDVDGDGLPEIPVSRVPDGRKASLLAGAIAPAAPSQGASRGLRNVARPFADGVYAALPSPASMLISKPVTYDQTSVDLVGDHVYLMLHGDYIDGTRFWGEGTLRRAEAMNTGNVGPVPGAVVLAGACWGALIVDKPALLVKQPGLFGARGPDTSIALAFLEQGAQAFVGCTGSHYSPIDTPYNYFGGPLHQAFWAGVLAGTAPAAALFAAKVAYIPEIPHARDTAAVKAVELKLWREFTCLGLGW